MAEVLKWETICGTWRRNSENPWNRWPLEDGKRGKKWFREKNRILEHLDFSPVKSCLTYINTNQFKHKSKHVILYKNFHEISLLLISSVSKNNIIIHQSPKSKLASALTSPFSHVWSIINSYHPNSLISLHSLSCLSGLDHLYLLPGLLQSFLTSLLALSILLSRSFFKHLPKWS